MNAKMDSNANASCRRGVFLALIGLTTAIFAAETPDLIITNGRIVTVDAAFSIHDAMSVKAGMIQQTGTGLEVMRLRGKGTRVMDLGGATVLPGLIDSHVHPRGALHEFDHEIPSMESISDVLGYIRSRAAVVPAGDWILLHQVFITRLRERRYPTRAELDSAAPNHPVRFSTGPDMMLNSAALRLAGIDRHYRLPDGNRGFVEVDPKTGEPSGLLRSVGGIVKVKSSTRSPNEAERYEWTLRLLRDYAKVGLTTVADKGANAGSIALYEKMLEAGDLPVRMRLSHTLGGTTSIESLRKNVAAIRDHPRARPNPWLQIIGTKIWLDGGMLTGSAYLREPWGVSDIYGITDPNYRGVLNVPREQLLPMVREVVKAGLQFTAHVVGDGAVHTLLDVYEEVDKETPVRGTRPGFTHSNFMSEDSVKRAARLGAVHDIQPAWLYLDAATLQKQFGYDRLKWFQPLKSIFEAGGTAGGGSDHMQKIGSFRAVNPYNPFLGMWVTLKREPRWYEGALHPEQCLSREQAIRFYTINNARVLRFEDQIGSLEAGKRADFIVLDRDILSIPAAEVREIRVLQTWVDGRRIQPGK
jgi:predicted amidohydrolase YtcJ